MKALAVAALTLASSWAGAPFDADKGKILGSPTAPVTIELYSSFACSHCKEFHDRILPMLMKDYIDTGKVVLVPRECFPPTMPMALEAANDATAAARIGKYHAVGNALFQQQQIWMASSNPWSAIASVLTPKEQKEVLALAKDPKVIAEVQHDLQLAGIALVDRTPTLVLSRGDKRYPQAGIPEYSLLKSLLDSMLAGK